MHNNSDFSVTDIYPGAAQFAAYGRSLSNFSRIDCLISINFFGFDQHSSGGAKPGPPGARAPAFKGRAPAVPRRMKSGKLFIMNIGKRWTYEITNDS